MMKTPIVLTTILITLSISKLTTAILSGYDEDITNNRQFRCRWEGGNVHGVTCLCEDYAEEMYIQKGSIPAYDTSRIQIANCPQVKFGPHAIEDMRNLREISLNQIKNLIFEETSINWHGTIHDSNNLNVPSLKVSIKNSNISLISSRAFQGRINEISIENSHIHTILPFAFSNLLQTELISLKNLVLNNTASQSFKKFQTENLLLTSVKAKMLESRTFQDVTVTNNLIIDQCEFETVRPGAFVINNPKTFQVTNSKITQLDGEAFKVQTRGSVLFKNNDFKVVNDGAFRGITVNHEETSNSNLKVIHFDSNTFTAITRDSLSVVDFAKKFTNMNINEQCDCKSIEHKIKEVEFYSEIRCLYDDEFVTIQDFKSNMCSIITSHATTFIIIGVVCILFIIVGTALTVYYKKVYRSRKYGHKGDKQPANLSLIVPDGRTYRETELHVIIEKTDLLTTDL